MPLVKYRVREYTPKGLQPGSHSFYAEAVIDNVIDNHALAKKIAARTGFKSYECAAVIAAIAEVVAEETAENNRVTLSNEDGTNLVSIYPVVSGKVSDVDVLSDPEAFSNAEAATEDMLTPDKLSWRLGASVGIKYSKQFSMNKRAQKVAYNPNQTPAAPADSGENGGGSGENGGEGGGNEYTGGGLGD